MKKQEQVLNPIPPLELTKKIIRKLNRKRIVELVVTGGEPTLNPNICEILNFASPLFPYLRLNTNGSRLNDNLLRTVKENSVDLLVSLHAANSKTHEDIVGIDDFNNTVSNIEKLASSELDISVMFVATPRNLNELFDVAKALERMKIGRLSVSRASISQNNRHLSDQFQLQKKDINRLGNICQRIEKETNLSIILDSGLPLCSGTFWSRRIVPVGCDAGTIMAAVSPYGEIRLCPRFSRSLGNILEERSWINWNQMAAPQMPSSCISCPLNDKCGHGCRAEAFYKFGYMSADDPLAKSLSQTDAEVIESRILGSSVNYCNNLLSTDCLVLAKGAYLRKTRYGYVLCKRGAVPRVLNKTGKEIIDLIIEGKGSISLVNIAQAIADSYSLKWFRAVKDVSSFVKDLHEFVKKKD
jgi:radical SAM protein with 4Fe4S-binding SPASM domain